MVRSAALLLLLLRLATIPAVAADDPVAAAILGSAHGSHQGYRVLERICDEGGGRLPGSPELDRTLTILEQELASVGLKARREPFTMPGWVRGEDAVDVLTPSTKRLRAVALGYVDAHPAFEAEVRWGGAGTPEELTGTRGAVALISPEAPKGGEALLRYEVITNAAGAGARGVLFINDKPGGLTLTGVSNFLGTPSPIPAYSITLEEGSWLRRSLAARVPVRVRLETRSRCVSTTGENLVATLPGKRKATIVVGAHVDSWDISQGAVDNGVGTAVVFEIARLLALHAPVNEYTIACVWFDGEELGLWGSKAYVAAHAKDSIVAMVNLDMPGSPTGVNVMGHDGLIPAVRQFLDGLPGYAFTAGVVSSPWSNSDHQPFLLEGIPAITLMGHLPRESVVHYHDFGDTFDKVDRRALVDAGAVTALLVRTLANAAPGSLRRLTAGERIATFRNSGMEQRLKRQGQWPF